MKTSGVFAAYSSCCLGSSRLNDKNMFSLPVSLPCLPLVIIVFYLVWWWGLVFSVSVIKIFKGLLWVCDSHILSFLFSFFISQSWLLICFLCSESGWEIKRRPVIVCLRARVLCFSGKRRLGYDRLRTLKVAEKTLLSLEAVQVHFLERFYTCSNMIVLEFLTICTSGSYFVGTNKQITSFPLVTWSK